MTEGRRAGRKEIETEPRKSAQEAQGVVEDSTPLSFCGYKEPKPRILQGALAAIYEPARHFWHFRCV